MVGVWLVVATDTVHQYDCGCAKQMVSFLRAGKVLHSLSYTRCSSLGPEESKCSIHSTSHAFNIYCVPTMCFLGFPGGSVVKNPPANAGDMGLISGWGRSPEEGDCSLFQYS